MLGPPHERTTHMHCKDSKQHLVRYDTASFASRRPGRLLSVDELLDQSGYRPSVSETGCFKNQFHDYFPLQRE
jgi:hypothetical protein